VKIRALAILIAFTVMAGVVGCGEDALFSPPQEILSILELRPERSELYPSDVISISAVIEHKGGSSLEYEWRANGGELKPSGAQAIYIAPHQPGEYEISLLVKGETVVDKRSVTVKVIPGSSVRIASGLYWPADQLEGRLKFRLRVDELLGAPRLKYELAQVNDQSAVFLTIKLNGEELISKAVGLMPGDEKGEIDLSGRIKGPGVYEFEFILKPANRVEKGWMLADAALANVKGEVL
jgi:hypothetical protein